MKTKYLITCANEVIVCGLKSLLSEQGDMECVGVYLNSEVDLKSMVDLVQPDVLVIDRQHVDHPYLSNLFPYSQYPELFVIVLEIDRNQFQIYQKGETYASSSTDLLSAIRNRGGKPS